MELSEPELVSSFTSNYYNDNKYLIHINQSSNVNIKVRNNEHKPNLSIDIYESTQNETVYHESRKVSTEISEMEIDIPCDKFDAFPNGSTYDTFLSIGGTSLHTYNSSISSILQNYNNAYYKNVDDRMFLLDVKQIYKVWSNENVLGSGYYRGKLTAKAVANSVRKDADMIEGGEWLYYLRSPSTYAGAYSYPAWISQPDDVRFVGRKTAFGEGVNWCSAYYDYGVRPAFYINQSSAILKSGTGAVGSPYVLMTVAAAVQAILIQMSFHPR